MDINDEFEMKPITPGLGFHKKSVSLKDAVRKTGLSKEEISRALPESAPEHLTEEAPFRNSSDIMKELMESLKPLTQDKNEQKKETAVHFESTESIVSPTLPRVGDVERRTNLDIEAPFPKERNPLSKIEFEFPEKEINDSGLRRGAHDSLIRPLVPISFSLSSAILDGIIVFALSLLFLISLLMVTGIDAMTVFASAQIELAAQAALGVLYLAVLQMYVVISRSFFGCTVGEWTFDLQVGDERQIAKANYPVLVLWRSLLITITGFVVFPILSLILGRDLPARLTGLQLYKKNI